MDKKQTETVIRYAHARLLAECHRRHGTQRRLAKATHYSESALSQIRKGKLDMSLDIAEALLAVWGMTPAEALQAAIHDGQLPEPVLAPQSSTLREAIQLRRDRWDEDTIDVLREMADVSTRHKARCTVGTWIDCGDSIQDASDRGTGVHTVKKMKGA